MSRHVVMVAYAGAQVLDITGPLEVFARTSRWLQEHRGLDAPAYTIELVATRSGPFATSSGLELNAVRSYREASSADTLLVTGGIGYVDVLDDRELLAWLKQQAGTVRRFCSICTGALILGAAGLLDGRCATTHWAYCDRLAALAPNCRIESDAIYVRDGSIYTSAGVTAGMDLALALVEEDWDKATALAVAQELVMYLKRPGGQAQFSRQLQAQQRDDKFGALELWMLDNFDGDLSVERLARQMGMSVRHFSRCFREQFRTTPAAYVARLRVEQARRRLDEGASSLKGIARQCGFGDEQALRRAFRQQFGVLPQAYRTHWG